MKLELFKILNIGDKRGKYLIRYVKCQKIPHHQVDLSWPLNISIFRSKCKTSKHTIEEDGHVLHESKPSQKI